jgi:histidine phosphotransferase ChpT
MTPSDDPLAPAPVSAGPDLVALVGARIAPDINNPIGAIANGVELLGLTGQVDGPEIGLITESVENARRRIKTFRIAFGAAAPGQRVAAAEIAELAAPGADGRRLEIDWPVSADLPRQDAKQVFLALMCLESAMPWGGRAAVRNRPGGWQIAAEAPRLKLEPAHWAMLEGAPAPADLAPGAVHFALLARETIGRGQPVSVGLSDTTIDLAF